MYRLILLLLIIAPSFIIGQSYDKMNMTLQSRTQLSGDLNDIWGYVKDGNEYAIVGTTQGVHFFDVSDCASPVQVGYRPGGSTWRDFKVYGNYGYGVCDNANCYLEVFDLDNNFAETTVTSFTQAHNIFVDSQNALLYAVGIGNSIKIFSLSNPASPTLLTTYFPPGNKYTHDIYVENNIMYCSHGYDNLGIYQYNQFTNSVSPMGSTTGSPGYNHSSWKHPYHSTLYLAEELPKGQPIFKYDVSDLMAPTWSPANSFKEPLLAPAHTNNRPHNPFVHGDYLYISYYHDGLQVWDVTDPETPVKVAYFDTYWQNTDYVPNWPGAWGTYPFLPSGCILVSDIDNGFYTLKIDEYKGYSEIDGDIYLKEAGAGIVFKDNSGSYQKVYLNNGSLITSSSGAPSSTDQLLMESHLELGESHGIIFTDASNPGMRQRLVAKKGGVALETVLGPMGSHLEVTQGDFYLSRKNAGIILSGADNCFKFFTDHNGNYRTPSHPCIPD